MRDLSLHILDIIENAIRVGASSVEVSLTEDPTHDLLTLLVEDNGPGLRVPPETAMNPFYTTKSGKRTGLGLSLFQAAAERAGGRLILRKARLGGLAVEATMHLSHVDRSPLGDMPATISSIVCTNPKLDLTLRFHASGRKTTLRISEILDELKTNGCCGLSAARKVSDRVKAAVTEMTCVS